MKNYDTFKVEDFVADERFCRWVLHPEGEEQALFEAFLRENPDKEELLREARQLVLGLRFREEKIDALQIDRIWSRIEKSSSGEEQASRSEKVRPFWSGGRISLAVAATVALLLAFWWLMRPAENVVLELAEGAAPKEYVLPDSSTVLLNAGSRVSYSPNKWEQEKMRALRLEGEAFFEVKKGKGSFEVESKLGKVRVLGTSFNIYDRGEKWEVKCFTGKVEVANENSGQFRLTPGQSSMYTSSGTSINVDSFELSTGNYQDWRQGYFDFDEAALEAVVREIGRQFGRRIIGADLLEGRQITIDFSREEGIERILSKALYPFADQFTFESDSEKIIIESK